MNKLIFLLLIALTLFVDTGCTSKNTTSDEPVLLEFNNPVITHKFTADPATLVYKDTVYLYVGHDQCPPNRDRYQMHEWLIFSSTDLINWKEEAVVPVKPTLSWARDDAWAAHTVERDGKFYWYVTASHNSIHGKAIGVLTSENPTGPWTDPIGKALVTNDMTTDTNISWDDIDPAIFIDDDGQAYMFWGNTKLKYVKLKDNMVELDGTIKRVENLPHFTEAPWIHKRGDWYYLTYAYDFPEKTAYAMSKSIEGPWVFKGILNEVAGNSNTNHQAILDYKGKSYFVYHNGSIPTAGGSFRRSVCIDELKYNADGTLQRVIMTSEGVRAE